MSTPSERLLAILVPAMEREGYAYRKTNHRFHKPFPFGKHEFTVMFDARGGLVGVDAAFFVHFDDIERQFKTALGYQLPWCAGATLLNAGASPHKYWLNEDVYATMTPKELKGLPSEVVHPPSRIEAAARFLSDAHATYAVPLFRRLGDHRALLDFYLEYLRNGCIGRCRPLRENVVYSALLVGGALGADLEEVVGFAKVMKSGMVGHDVETSAAEVARRVRGARG